MTVREASEADVEPMVAMADDARRAYGEQEPLFWRPAADAVELHRPWLARLVADPEVGTFVSETAEGGDGFVVVTLVSAPPVYDIGGPSSLVDDFAVSSPDRWPEVGPALLHRARAWARERGAVQVVVVCGPHDEAKRAVLRTEGLHVASEWHTAPLEGP